MILNELPRRGKEKTFIGPTNRAAYIAKSKIELNEDWIESETNPFSNPSKNGQLMEYFAFCSVYLLHQTHTHTHISHRTANFIQPFHYTSILNCNNALSAHRTNSLFSTMCVSLYLASHFWCMKRFGILLCVFFTSHNKKTNHPSLLFCAPNGKWHNFI